MSDFGKPGTFWYVWGLVFLFIFTAIVLLGIIVAIVRSYKNKKNIAKMIPRMEEIFDEEGFMIFCYEMIPLEILIRNAEREYDEADKKMKDLVEELDRTGAIQRASELKNAKCDMLIKNARLESLRTGRERDLSNIDVYTREEIWVDYRQIRAMRGVQQICVDEDKLCIYVRATYPYEGILYDLGDYRIKYSRDAGFAVIVARGRSFYAEYDGKDLNFCVERHKSEVKQYLSTGRIAEATMLIIDNLHHINSEDLDDIPYEYRPIRKLTRREKKKIKYEY